MKWQERKEQIERAVERPALAALVATENRNEMLRDCLEHIAELEKERDALQRIIEIHHLADEKEQEILRGIVVTGGGLVGTVTLCADCGKPAGDIHNCPEQARANRKARSRR